MKLPNLGNAVVDIAKLRDYCLNPTHRRGQHKAKVFASALGFTAHNAVQLQEMIFHAIKNEEASVGKKDEFGQRYSVDFQTQRKSKGQVTIRTTWIIRLNEDFPRLTSCYVA